MSSEEKEEKRITRREFVRGAAVVGAAGVLASCGPTPAPQIVKETVEVPVEVTKIVEKIVEVPAGEAVEAGPVALEVFDPTGAFEVTELHAARLDTLEGKTICELSNLGWQSIRTMPYLRDVLQKMYPTAKFIPWEELTPTREHMDDLDHVEKVLQENECDAAIVGNAG
jgi:hypothetical protein